MIEVTKRFGFDAAHTLQRHVDAEGSRRIHGHSYQAEVAIEGEIDPTSGMVVDLGILARTLEGVRDGLDHRLLDEVEGLGPATLENLAMWIWAKLQDASIGGLTRVTGLRESAGEIETLSGAPVADSIAVRAANQLEAHPEDLTHAAETLTIGLSAAH